MSITCVYIWQANQKQRSLLDPYNSVMIGYPAEWSSAMPCHNALLSINSVNIESLCGLVFDNHREVEAEHKANTLLAL